MRLNGGLLSRGTSEYVKNMKKQIRTTERGRVKKVSKRLGIVKNSSYIYINKK